MVTLLAAGAAWSVALNLPNRAAGLRWSGLLALTVIVAAGSAAAALYVSAARPAAPAADVPLALSGAPGAAPGVAAVLRAGNATPIAAAPAPSPAADAVPAAVSREAATAPPASAPAASAASAQAPTESEPIEVLAYSLAPVPAPEPPVSPDRAPTGPAPAESGPIEALAYSLTPVPAPEPPVAPAAPAPPPPAPDPAPQAAPAAPALPDLDSLPNLAALTAGGASAIPDGDSVFEHAQVVSLYGYPGIPVMGALGAYDPDEAIRQAGLVAAQYDAINGARGAIPALHLIVAVAQRHPGADGRYLARMDSELVSAYVEAARRHDALLFVDVQVGWSDVLTEVDALAEALSEPFVHLALDPEFATRSRGAAPGLVIGSLRAEDVNAVQAYLARMVRRLGLPPKVLVLHQFQRNMLSGTERYDDVPEVELTIDMDGFGGTYAKLSKYDLFSLSSYAERPAIKLFYEWDAPLITPQELQNLATPPALVIYQ